MKNDHLERLRFLASNYELLQGYPIALVGLLNVLEGISVMIWGYSAVHVIYGWLFLASVGLLAIAMNIAQRHYRRKFGVVKVSMEPRRVRGILIFAILYVVLIVLGGADFKHLKVALEPTVLNAGIILRPAWLPSHLSLAALCGCRAAAGGSCHPSRLPCCSG